MARIVAWPMQWRRHSSKESLARHADLTSKRLSALQVSINGLEDADPSEVEARIRNLTHGTGPTVRARTRHLVPLGTPIELIRILTD